MSKLFDDASLVMIPSAYKDGKLYSIRPTDGSGDFTFSRGSNLAATRVDVNGLIEKGRENLITYSNDFLNASWGKGSILSVTDGHSGYDGSNDASLVVPDTSLAGHLISKFGATYTGLQTYSVYAKNGGYDLQLRATGIGSTNIWVSFDLTNGVVGTTGGGHIDSSITSLGGGWYRCSMTFTTASAPYIGIYQVPNGATASQAIAFVGDGTSGLYIQDSQVERSLVLTDYIETGATTAQAGILEDMPRLDYSASCPSLLLEPQRTNVVKQSEYFESSEWIDQSIDTALELVSSGSPDGNAFYRCTSGASGGGRIVDVFTGSMSGGVFSLYAKGSGSLMIDLFITGGSNVTETITLTSEWTRYDVYNSRVDSGGDASIRFYPNAVADIYGAQIESGSYPTSYIPTYGTSQTRSKDIGNVFSVGDLLGQEQGTMFLDFIYGEASSTNIILQMRKTTGAQRQVDFRIQGGNLVVLANSAGTTQFYLDYGTAVAGTRYKAAVRYGLNDSALYVNGSLIASDTTCDFSEGTFEQVTFNEAGGSLIEKNRINQAVLFPTALTDSECIALTTL